MSLVFSISLLSLSGCEPPTAEETAHTGPTAQDIAEASMLFRALNGDDRRPQGLLLVRELQEGMEKKALVQLLGNPDTNSTDETWTYQLDNTFSKINISFDGDSIRDVAWDITEQRLQLGETAKPPQAFPAPEIPKEDDPKEKPPK